MAGQLLQELLHGTGHMWGGAACRTLSTRGKGHPLRLKPHRIRDLMLSTGSDQAILLRLQHSSARAEEGPWSSQQHLWARAKSPLSSHTCISIPAQAKPVDLCPNPGGGPSRGAAQTQRWQLGPPKSTDHKAILQ